ncbi:MAG: radical SAM protein [Candidatus Colwellbacteria bacterium]|nr:radical SAM protein [Candidatus Colwellbacteria bacterium]
MDVCVWNRCNNRCVMCTNPEGFGDVSLSGPYSYEGVLSRVLRIKDIPDSAAEAICLTGGEPTSHPEFLRLVSTIKRELPNNQLILATNGRMFAYEEFARKYLAIGSSKIEIPIHGSEARLHDAITCVKGSFEQTIQGIENILKYMSFEHELEIRLVLTKINLHDTRAILDLVKESFPRITRVVVIFPEFEGMCAKNMEVVGLKYSDVKEEMTGLISEWKESFDGLSLYHFPLCSLPVGLWGYAWRTLRGNEIMFPEQCNGCRFKKYCLGVHVDYAKLIGTDEFMPPTGNIKIKENNGPDREYHPIIEAI